MPNEGISIYFTIKDGASQVLKTIGDRTKALDKETRQLAGFFAVCILSCNGRGLFTQSMRAVCGREGKTGPEFRRIREEGGRTWK